ncbi:hypothetical protein R5R35_005326 [Gryllus longicercus]|uniref:Non-structural maintenance of chromosomes element 1 homolog n=1 Tax=Gryllus longicercus TaxID=2509291 RepID=A0AAN9Z6B7_9ORTH
MNSYGDVHRRFLQSFVYYPAQTEKEAFGVYRHACLEQGQQLGCLNTLIEEINRVITRFTTLEIKTGLCELTSKKYYVATNTTECTWMKSTSIYSKKEQYIFKRIVNELIRSAKGYVSSIAFLNLPVKGSITKSERVEILSKFVRDKWLSVKEGNYYMGVRGVLELEPYILQHYRDMLSFCPLCNKLIFWVSFSIDDTRFEQF